MGVGHADLMISLSPNVFIPWFILFFCFICLFAFCFLNRFGTCSVFHCSSFRYYMQNTNIWLRDFGILLKHQLQFVLAI